MDRKVTFVFPKGHPREGKDFAASGVMFVKGSAEFDAEDAAKLETILTRYYGAVIQESPEQAAAEERYVALRAVEARFKKESRKLSEISEEEVAEEIEAMRSKAAKPAPKS